jgi:hypothetical protein
MRASRSILVGIITSLVATGVEAQTPAPVFTMSAYHRCDINRQARADTLFNQIYAPALDKQVKAGHLTGYGFLSHRVGGAWRRLQSMSASSLADLMAGQAAAMEEIGRTNQKGLTEFNSICGSHDDYIWSRASGSAPNPSAPPVPGGGFLYSRYFFCSDEGTADLVMDAVGVAVMNKQVADGHITGWSWLRHSTGGTIRRVLNWNAPDALSALTASQQISAALRAEPMWSAFANGCNGHTDYLWHVEATGQ